MRRSRPAAEGNHRRHLEARSPVGRASRRLPTSPDAGEARRRRCAQRTEAVADAHGGSRAVAPHAGRPRRSGRRRTAPTPMPRAVDGDGPRSSALDGQKTGGGAAARDGGAQPAAARRRAEAQRKEVDAAGRPAAGADRTRRSRISRRCSIASCSAQQQTNYETPKTAEEKREDSQDETLERVRELARRQEALQRQQDDLARDRQQLDEEEVRRRLERLTREQSDLRREAELLAQQMQQNERRQREQGQRGSRPSGASRASGGSRGSRASRAAAAGRQGRARAAGRAVGRTAAGLRGHARRGESASPRGSGRRAQSERACARAAEGRGTLAARRPGPTSGVAPSATRSSKRASLPLASGRSANRPAAPCRAAIRTPRAGWPASRSSSRSAPTRSDSASISSAAKAATSPRRTA